jgi:Transmembrane secretion effector
MRMPTASGPNELSLDVLADPEVRLSLTPRSGPIVIEIEYRVDPAKARLFYAVMQHVQLSRQRNGAYGWSIARDIADPDCGQSAIIVQRGMTICGSEADRRRRNAPCTSAPTNSISVPNPSGFGECWSALSDLYAGKRTRLIDRPPPPR